MASGDAQRTWFLEMVEMLGQTWSPSMSETEWIALRDRLDTTLQTIRRERPILPAMMWCPRCQSRHRSAPPKVSVRAMILALGQFELASVAEIKALERRCNTYRRHHQLDRFGMKESVAESPGACESCQSTTTEGNHRGKQQIRFIVAPRINRGSSALHD